MACAGSYDDEVNEFDVVIVGAGFAGMGSEIASEITEEAFDDLDADRPRWQQSTEQHPRLAEPDANRLIPVVRLERLAPVEGDVVCEHDLAIVTANDAFTPGQLD